MHHLRILMKAHCHAPFVAAISDCKTAVIKKAWQISRSFSEWLSLRCSFVGIYTFIRECTLKWVLCTTERQYFSLATTRLAVDLNGKREKGREAGLRHVACIVRERQRRLCGHVARLPAEDPAHQILFVKMRGAGPCRGSVHRLHGCVRSI